MNSLRKFVQATEIFVLAALGILMVYMVCSGVSKYFVAHTLSPYIFLTGVLFVCWAGNGIYLMAVRGMGHYDGKKGLQTLVLYAALLCVSFAAFHYENVIYSHRAGYKRSGSGISGSSGKNLTDAELKKLIQHYPDQNQTTTGTETSAPKNVKLPPNTLKADSGTMLEGYYRETKHIEINDTQLYPWMVQIEEHLNDFTGWTVTMRGQVVKDPSIFEPGTFSPTRELMTCCVADLSVIGLTCLYDVSGPFASLIQDGNWLVVTGIITAGTYQGDPEPQIKCTSVKRSSPPDDPYLYP